eukprot:1134951-Pyramimonas_sp.AAC.1
MAGRSGSRSAINQRPLFERISERPVSLFAQHSTLSAIPRLALQLPGLSPDFDRCLQNHVDQPRCTS